MRNDEYDLIARVRTLLRVAAATGLQVIQTVKACEQAMYCLVALDMPGGDQALRAAERSLGIGVEKPGDGG